MKIFIEKFSQEYIEKYNSVEPHGYKLPEEKQKYEYLTINEIIELLIEVIVDLTALKKSVTSKEIKEKLKWAINGIDIVGCELTQNIAKKLKNL